MAKKCSNELTKKQKEVLIYIKKFLAENKYPPSVRDICKALNLNSSATGHSHINNLIEKGYLKRNSKGNKPLELLVPNEFEKNFVVSIPLLGNIAAGSPIEAIESSFECIDIPDSMIPKNKTIFALRVQGDSMINAGILDNDIVIVEAKNTANNGEIVVAMTDENEATLKRFYKEENYIRLQPENDFMTPIILPNVTILGKAIGLYRKI